MTMYSKVSFSRKVFFIFFPIRGWTKSLFTFIGTIKIYCKLRHSHDNGYLALLTD